MSDYLSNLSARSLGRAEDIPLVRPRLPALFEPSQAEWSAPSEIHSEPPEHRRPHDESSPSSLSHAREEPQTLDRIMVRSTHQDTAPNPTSEDVSPSHRRHRQTEQGSPAENPQDRKPVVRHLPGPDPRTVIMPQTSGEHSDDRPPKSAVQDGIPGAVPSRMVAPASVDAVPPSRENSQPSSARRSQKEGATQPLAPAGRNLRGVENVMEKEHGERILDRSSSSAPQGREQRKLVVPPRVQQPLGQDVTPVLRSGMTSAPRITSAKAEPAIRVTIGRVEVRATVSPQRHSGKSATPIPVMGLEEYLRRRTGGRD